MPSRRHCVTVWGTSVHHNSLSYHKGVALNTYWWQFSVYFLFVLPFRPMDSNALRMGIMHIGIYSVWRFVTDECSKKTKTTMEFWNMSSLMMSVYRTMREEVCVCYRKQNDGNRIIPIVEVASRRKSTTSGSSRWYQSTTMPTRMNEILNAKQFHHQFYFLCVRSGHTEHTAEQQRHHNRAL